MGRDFGEVDALSKALSSGDLSGAQQAFSTLLDAFKGGAGAGSSTQSGNVSYLGYGGKIDTSA